MLRLFSSFLLLTLIACGCASKTKRQADMRRAYAAGEQAARAQMEQAQTAQVPQPESNGDPQIRILGPVKNPVLEWSEGLTLARALVQAQYTQQKTPAAITIYRNNVPLQIDPQTLLQGQDYPLFPGDTVYIQN